MILRFLFKNTVVISALLSLGLFNNNFCFRNNQDSQVPSKEEETHCTSEDGCLFINKKLFELMDQKTQEKIIALELNHIDNNKVKFDDIMEKIKKNNGKKVKVINYFYNAFNVFN